MPNDMSEFSRGWATDETGAGKCSHLFLRFGDNAMALCGLRIPLAWLSLTPGRPRCHSCESIMKKQGAAPI